MQKSQLNQRNSSTKLSADKGINIGEWLAENAAEYIYLYGLERWTINFLTGDGDISADNATSVNPIATVCIDPEHEVADITFSTDQINDEELLRHALEHELRHVVLAPYEEAEQLIYGLGLNNKVQNLLQQSFYQAAEHAQKNVEIMLLRHKLDSTTRHSARVYGGSEASPRGRNRRKGRKTSK